MILRPPRSTLFPYTMLFRSTLVGDLLPLLEGRDLGHVQDVLDVDVVAGELDPAETVDREVPERVRTRGGGCSRSEEHTSELQSLRHLVCRLLLEKKKTCSTTTIARLCGPTTAAVRTCARCPRSRRTCPTGSSRSPA